MSSENNERFNFFVFFLIPVLFIPFFCFVALVRTSDTLLNSRCRLILDLNRRRLLLFHH